MPNGGKRLRSALKTAFVLGALQATDRHELENTDEDRLGSETTLSDESLLSEPTEGVRGSVLDIGAQTKSYVAQSEAVQGPLAGEEVLASPGMQFERQRERERQTQMRRTQEQFIGGPGLRREESRPEHAMRARRPRDTEVTEFPEEPPELTDAMRSRGMELEAARVADQTKASARQGIKQQFAENKKKHLQRIKNVLEGADIATAEDGLNLILLIGEMNVQLLNKYFFKYDLIPEQTLPEDAVTVCLDISMCTNPTSPPCCCFLAIILIVAIIFQLTEVRAAVHVILGQ